MELVLASSNHGKLKELQARLGEQVHLRLQSEFGINTPQENGQSFVENAFLKARYVCQHTGLPAIADDSGLCVDFLDGRPGVYSARFAGENATDQANNSKILEALQGVASNERSASFQCVLVALFPDPALAPIICQAAWQGQILLQPRGDNGFGYDPLFQPQGLSCSSAELAPDEKNRISHRGQAMHQLIARLKAQALI